MGKAADDFLAHYGIPGMRWGKRSGGGAKASTTKSKDTSPDSPDVASVKKSKEIIKKSGTKALSNKELQDVVTRMNLEQQYSKLSPSKKSAGSSAVKKVLADTGKEVAKEYAKTAAKAGIAIAVGALLKK